MKDNQYLTHDLGARNDAKIVELQMELGCEGIGIYWCLIEMLWEQGGYLPRKYKTLAFSIRGTQEDTVRRVVEDFGLFEIDGDEFFSRSALERLEHKKNQSEAKAAGGRKGAATTNNKKPTMPQDSSDYAETEPQQCRSSAAAMPQQKVGNKLINKLINNYSFVELDAPEKEKLLEIFYFDLAVADAPAEINSFLNYYSAVGWKLGNGLPIQDPLAVARNWKPKGETHKYPPALLAWIRKIYTCAGHALDSKADFLLDIYNAKLNGDTIDITFKTPAIGQAIRDLVDGNNLAGRYKINWRCKK